MMTERANRISKWVVEEIVVHKLNSKQRKMTIRKMIEIAKVILLFILTYVWTHHCYELTALLELEQFSYLHGDHYGTHTTTRISR